ncbi:hypothetical protein V500_04395 [Pseudogymnoascus sp. VKM F-4518 (FW-2643)]|nr:hypothetical protein V500_04395 [Pseudogymnoascus sp. VKM F-4518 (FW-2643)]
MAPPYRYGAGCPVGLVWLALDDLRPQFGRRLVRQRDDHVMEYLFFVPIDPFSGMDGYSRLSPKLVVKAGTAEQTARICPTAAGAEDVGIGGWQIASW